MPVWLLFLFLFSSTASAANSCVILQYHHFSRTTPPITSVTPEQFDAQLDYLESHHFNVMALRDVALSLQHQIELPEKCVSFSIDDAYLSVYTTAYPKLKQRGWPFSVFVNTQAVDRHLKPMMNWDQMREMSRHGASFENHGHAHLHMIRRKKAETEAQWLQRIRHDIERGKQRITQETGSAPRLFAWPYGEFNPTLNRLIEGMGYIGFGQQSGPAWPDANLSALPRFPMASIYANLKGFISKVNTLPMPLISALPKDPLLPPGQHRPTLRLKLAPGRYQKNSLRCYLDGSDQLNMEWPATSADTLLVTPRFDLKPGRHRTNCTMPSSRKGHFHWYSHNWFVRNDDASWYAEY